MDGEGVNGLAGAQTGLAARTTLAELMAIDTEAEIDVEATTAEPPGRCTTSTSIILFGRTGSGKSTLAQMLTLGRLHAGSENFASSSGIRGETKMVKLGKGRDWMVLDTPGFGEPKDKLSTISSEEAEKKIKRYLQQMEGTYTHFLYLVMKDRIDELDKRLWTFFVRLCRENIKSNFSIVLSNASREWLDQNRADLRSTFEGCDSFLSAEFPTTRSDDDEWETELQEVRLESLKQLEDDLNRLGRQPVKCDFDGGLWQMTSKQIVVSGATLKRLVMKVIDAGVSGVVRSILQVNCLIHLLKQDEKYLMPQLEGGSTRASVS